MGGAWCKRGRGVWCKCGRGVWCKRSKVEPRRLSCILLRGDAAHTQTTNRPKDQTPRQGPTGPRTQTSNRPQDHNPTHGGGQVRRRRTTHRPKGPAHRKGHRGRKDGLRHRKRRNCEMLWEEAALDLFSCLTFSCSQ